MEPGSPYVPTLDDYVDVPRVDSIKTLRRGPLAAEDVRVLAADAAVFCVIGDVAQTPQQRMTVERPSSRTDGAVGPTRARCPPVFLPLVRFLDVLKVPLTDYRMAATR